MISIGKGRRQVREQYRRNPYNAHLRPLQALERCHRQHDHPTADRGALLSDRQP